MKRQHLKIIRGQQSQQAYEMCHLVADFFAIFFQLPKFHTVICTPLLNL